MKEKRIKKLNVNIMTEDDIKYRQGRSKRQVEGNEMISMYAFGGLIVVLIGIVLYSLIKS